MRERSAAIGLFNAGTAIGAVAAAPVVAWIISISNWRWAFFVAGAMGLLWTLWWLWEYYPPAEDSRLSETERDEIKEVFEQPAAPQTPTRWLDLLALPQVWGLVLAKCLSDAAWFYYSQWLPKYLYDMHHFKTSEVGCVRLDSVRRLRHWQLTWRRFLRLAFATRLFAELFAQIRAGAERRLHAVGVFSHTLSGKHRNCAL